MNEVWTKCSAPNTYSTEISQLNAAGNPPPPGQQIPFHVVMAMHHYNEEREITHWTYTYSDGTSIHVFNS
jgi:hypothetical protein